MGSGSERSGPASSLEDRIAAALEAEQLEVDADRGHVALREALEQAVVAVEGEIAELATRADRRLADRCRALIELGELREAIAEDLLRRRLQTFGRVHDALTRLRQHTSVDAIIRSAPAEAATACDLDRVVIYRVDGGGLLAESFHVRDDPDQAAELLAFSRENPLQLRQDILETELIRRRRPMVVRDAFEHPNTWKPFIERYETFAYVAAPIAPEGRVIGFAHADKAVQRPGDRNGVDEFDRDVLWAFAEGLGYAIERMQLLERLQAQGQEVRRLIAQTETVVADYLDAKVELLAGPLDGAATARTAAAIFAGTDTPLERALTRRELEVLELVAGGATNGQIADKLFITEGTAKTHVGRILRKLGAGNRVEAASIYLRARSAADA